MFTGLIQAVGQVQQTQSARRRPALAHPVGSLPMDDVQLGESIAVSGVCLTVVAFDAGAFAADASNETLSLTTLGGLAVGAAVNLERALLPTTRLGGHLVSRPRRWPRPGARQRGDDGRSQRWRFTAPPALLRYIAEKGSICVDGVSLTVNAADDAGFEVEPGAAHHRPHRFRAARRSATPVNLEVDLIARYVERLLHRHRRELNHEFRHRSPNCSKTSAPAAWS